MGLLNGIQCAIPGTGNTGFGKCVFDFGRVRSIILVPKGQEFTFTDLATLKTALEAGIINNDPLLRFYPVHNLVPNADNTEDVSIQTYPDGTKVITREGDYDWTFDVIEGKFCLHYRLRKHNFISEDVLLIDEFGHLIGTVGSAADTIKGVNPTISFQQAVRPSQGTDAVTAYRYRLSFSTDQINESIAMVDFGNAGGGYAYLKSLTGLQDVALTEFSRATNVLKITATTACGSVNMYEQYSTDLADAALWSVKAESGAALTLTSVAADANIKGWTLTVDTSDPDYVAGDDFTVSWAGPATLASNDVVGYESDSIVVAP